MRRSRASMEKVRIKAAACSCTNAHSRIISLANSLSLSRIALEYSSFATTPAVVNGTLARPRAIEAISTAELTSPRTSSWRRNALREERTIEAAFIAIIQIDGGGSEAKTAGVRSLASIDRVRATFKALTSERNMAAIIPELSSWSFVFCVNPPPVRDLRSLPVSSTAVKKSWAVAQFSLSPGGGSFSSTPVRTSNPACKMSRRKAVPAPPLRLFPFPSALLSIAASAITRSPDSARR
mmetsp:Transcript_15438/g.39050  ORF Transcript_15438/g.39050 Transcript_15438/m.39050 type:complete len:238 (-) Transcript_15438:319-1032(-)